MFFDKQSETRPLDQQYQLDRASYARQIAYLFENSGFYQNKLREAGFSPSEVFRSATLYGAEELFEPKGEPIDFGIIRPGLKADLLVVKENPLQNLKILYGTGAVRLSESGEVG